MKKILIPTDFSENSWNAIQYGMELLKKTKCTFYIFHINPIAVYSGAESTILATPEIVEQTILKKSKEDLQKLLKRIERLPFNTKHDFVTITTYDFFVDSIKKEVEDKNIDLIIMGTKGASGLKKMTIGSNTGDVITKVKCPLLAVPEDTIYKRPKEIAFPTDYQIGYDLKVLNTLMDMVNMNQSALRILYISKKDEELSGEQLKNKELLHEYFKDLEHSFHSVTNTKLESGVQCFSESRNIDMIAMVAKNLNYFQRILFRPAVEEISYHTEIPFLVLHE